jgi:hypothetical protein
MTYYQDEFAGFTRAHAFVPDTMSPLNNQPQYSEDALRDGPVIAGGNLGAYFAQVPAERGTAALYREITVPGLGAIPGIPGVDVNAIIGPIVQQLEPTMDRVFSKYMPRVESAVASAVKSGINQGVAQAWPTVERKAMAMVEPYRKVGIAFGLISVATLAGVAVLLVKKGK